MANRSVKWFLLGVVAVLMLGVALHLYNYFRIDMIALATNARPILSEAEAISAKANPQYQEVALAGLPPNPRNGPFVRLDEILDRATVSQAPPPITVENSVLRSLEFDRPMQPDLSAANEELAVNYRDGVIEVVQDPDDYLVNEVAINVPRDEVGDILIRAKADKGTYMRLAWAGADGPFLGKIWHNMFDVRFVDNYDFHNYTINARNVLKRGLRPGESLKQLFINVADVPGAKVEIDYIRFISKAARFAVAPYGVDDETIAGELRRIVFMRPNQALEFALKVPERQPRLDFGMGLLIDQRPLRFEVELTQPDGTTVTLYDETVSSTERWRDARVDLTAWAGEDVRLTLRSTGDIGNVAFWSSPVISSAPVERFNVIVLVEDAQRADYLSVYGHPTKTTPFKERLMAERGVLFEHAMSQAEKTRPSAAAYMTSLYPTATGLWHFGDVLSDRHLTWAELMRAQGYVTASLTQNGNVGPYGGMHQGFDQVLDETAIGITTEELFTGNRARAFLTRNRDRNFFLYLHAIDPHAPYDMPAPSRERFLADLPPDGEPVARSPVYDPPWLEQPTINSGVASTRPRSRIMTG